MVDNGPDSRLLKWCLSRMIRSCTDEDFPAPPELGLPDGPQDASLHTTVESISTFYEKFVKSKIETQLISDRGDVFPSLSYASGLCVTRQFVVELVKELLHEEHSPSPSVHPKGDECGSSSLPREETHSEVTFEAVKLEVNEDCEMKHTPEIEADDDNHVKMTTLEPQPHRRHRMCLSKKVPASYALCMRGVKCKICGKVFKGAECVEKLTDHTRDYHKKQATRRFLNKIREENKVEDIIGSGMLWCECPKCLFLARAHGWLKKC